MKALACVCCKPLMEVLRERFGPIPDDCFSISRRYPGRKSPTRSPVWWFDLPVASLRDVTCGERYLVCRAAGCGCCSFDVLRVPARYILENLAGLRTVKRDGETFVRLLLSAAPVGCFTDLFGAARIDFARWKI